MPNTLALTFVKLLENVQNHLSELPKVSMSDIVEFLLHLQCAKVFIARIKRENIKTCHIRLIIFFFGLCLLVVDSKVIVHRFLIETLQLGKSTYFIIDSDSYSFIKTACFSYLYQTFMPDSNTSDIQFHIDFVRMVPSN